jgi:hypothetical protein
LQHPYMNYNIPLKYLKHLKHTFATCASQGDVNGPAYTQAQVSPSYQRARWMGALAVGSAHALEKASGAIFFGWRNRLKQRYRVQAHNTSSKAECGHAKQQGRVRTRDIRTDGHPHPIIIVDWNIVLVMCLNVSRIELHYTFPMVRATISSIGYSNINIIYSGFLLS